MKTLFVDFDGTICHDRFWRSLPNNENTLIQDFLFTGKNSIIVDWMRGAYTSEEINKLVANETGLDYEYLWNTFTEDCKTMRVSLEVLDFINQLRSKFHVVLITGNMDCFSRFTSPSLQLNKYFDVIVNSSDEKQLKTDEDGASFLKYVRGEIGDAILIEDSEKSCQTFKNIGGKPYQIKQPSDIFTYLKSVSS